MTARLAHPISNTAAPTRTAEDRTARAVELLAKLAVGWTAVAALAALVGLVVLLAGLS